MIRGSKSVRPSGLAQRAAVPGFNGSGRRKRLAAADTGVSGEVCHCVAVVEAGRMVFGVPAWAMDFGRGALMLTARICDGSISGWKWDLVVPTELIVL